MADDNISTVDSGIPVDAELKKVSIAEQALSVGQKYTLSENIVPDNHTHYRLNFLGTVSGVLRGTLVTMVTWDGTNWQELRRTVIDTDGIGKDGLPRAIPAYIAGQFPVVPDGAGGSLVKKPVDIRIEFEPASPCTMALELQSERKPVSTPSTLAQSPAFVQSTGTQTATGVGSDTAAFGVNVTAGNLIVGGGGVWSDSGATIDVTDSLSNAYNPVTTFPTWYSDGTFDEQSMTLEYAQNITGGACTVTFDSSGATNDLAWEFAEFSGIATSSALDQVATNELSNTATDANVTSGATTQAEELVVALASVAISGDIDVAWGANATTGYTNIGKYENYTTFNSYSFDYKVVAATGTQSANWSHDACNGLAKNGWGCVIATFKATVTGRTTKNTRSWPLGINVGMGHRMNI